MEWSQEVDNGSFAYPVIGTPLLFQTDRPFHRPAAANLELPRAAKQLSQELAERNRPSGGDAEKTKLRSAEALEAKSHPRREGQTSHEAHLCRAAGVTGFANGRWFRILTVVDQYSRECLCAWADRSARRTSDSRISGSFYRTETTSSRPRSRSSAKCRKSTSGPSNPTLRQSARRDVRLVLLRSFGVKARQTSTSVRFVIPVRLRGQTARQ